MNEITSDTIGVFRRELRDTRTLAANMDRKLRSVLDGGSSFERPAGLVARAAVCSVFSHTQRRGADTVAREHFQTDRDLEKLLVLRAAVNPANTSVASWAAELVQTITVDVADRLIPESVFARLRALGSGYTFTGGSFIKVPTWSPTATGGFIAEGAAIPVSKFTFGAITLGAKKAANIVAVSDELTTGSPLDVEATLRTILSESIGLMIDGILLGSTAATAAAPAGLRNGVSAITASVLTPAAAAMGADVKALLAAIAPALKPVLITGPTQAASLSLLAPNTALTVLVAPTVAAGTVIAVDASAFASALGVPSFRASENATIHEEDTNPLALATGVQGAGVLAVPMRSGFQTDVTSLRTIIPCDWTLRRTGAVAYLTGATW